MNNVYDGKKDYFKPENRYKYGLIQNYTSIQWLTEFDDSGEFCIECVATDENIKILQPNYIVVRNDVKEWNIGIIQKVSIKENKMSVRGTLDPLDHLVNINVAKITDVKEGISNMLNQTATIPFSLSNTNVSNTVAEMDIQYKDYQEIIKKVCNTADLGYAMIGLYGVRLYSGNMIINNMLSDMLDNIINQVIDLDSTNVKSHAIVLGDQKDSVNTIVRVNNPINVDTFSEVFIDAKSTSRKYKDSAGAEKTYTDIEYENLLIKKGLEKLEKCIPINKFSCEVNTAYEHLKIGIDYKLGDIIKVKSTKYNYIVNMRIIKIKEIFEESKKVIITLETKEG